MKLTSPAFEDGEMILAKYTCDGEDINPPLEIYDPPTGTESFAIIMHDHDAGDGDFVHWLIWNIDAATEEIKEGSTPIGSVEGTNDFPKVGYGGPCPLSGMHRYELHLYALDTTLNLPTIATKDELRDAIEAHILEDASFSGVYEKSLSLGQEEEI